MIVDVSGTVLVPGNGGADCPGNGSGVDDKGALIECCCDECDYMQCCYEACSCAGCTDPLCPRAQRGTRSGWD